MNTTYESNRDNTTVVQIYRNDIYLHFSTYSLQLYSCYYILYLSACIELLLTWSSIHCHLSVISIPVSFSFSFLRRIDWFADLCSASSREDKQQQQQINNYHKDRFFFKPNHHFLISTVVLGISLKKRLEKRKK